VVTSLNLSLAPVVTSLNLSQAPAPI